MDKPIKHGPTSKVVVLNMDHNNGKVAIIPLKPDYDESKFYGHLALTWKSLQHCYLVFMDKPSKHQQVSSFLKDLLLELLFIVHCPFLMVTTQQISP
jgi:hypothetical protein